MKKQHKYYVSALVTCNGNSHLVEFISDDVLEIVTIHQNYMMRQHPEFYGLEVSPTDAEVSNVSRIVKIRDWK